MSSKLSYEESVKLHVMLASKSDAATKIKFLYKIFTENNIYPSFTNISKSDSEAKFIRKEGNKLYKEKNFVDALECYNKSICLATSGSEDVAIGFANRSAVYFESGFYKFCLENIEMALKGNYPEKLRFRLEKRKEDCEKIMIGHADTQEKYQKEPNFLSYHPDKKIPMMIDGLEVAESNQFGRHIRAKRDLYPGDIIIIEKPYSKCITEKDWFKKCANCLKTNFLNLFPCHECTKAMFCSESCRQEAWRRFHRFECPIIHEITKGMFNPLGIRQTLLAFTQFDDTNILQKVVQVIDTETENAFTLDYSNPNYEQKFRTIYSLVTHENSLSIDELNDKINPLCAIWHFFKTNTDISNVLLKTPKIEDLFLNILFRFKLTTTYNGYALEEVPGTEFGRGCFALCSLINHSCAPNVTRFTDGNSITVVVRRVIKKGDQIFDYYYPHHQHMGREDRKKYLKEHYKFDCKCEACVKNYPLISDMPDYFNLYTINEEVFVKLNNSEETFAKEKLSWCRNFLKENYENYPSYEVCATENVLVKCCEVLYLPKKLKILKI